MWNIISFFFFFNVYLFLRQSMNRGGAERERETQNRKQAPGSEPLAESPTRGSNSIVTWAEVGGLTYWATQAPRGFSSFYRPNNTLLLFIYTTFSFFLNLLSNWFPYNTQCSSQQVPSSMPITLFPLSPTPSTLSLFSVFKSLLWFASCPVFILFFLSFPYDHLLNFSPSTYEWDHVISAFLCLTYFA